MTAVLLVGLGSAAGAALRMVVALLRPGPGGTLVVNATGCLLAGLAAGLVPPLGLLLGAGLCGGLTTFSTFAVEAAEPPRPRYALLTVAVCLVAAAPGLLLAATR